MNTEGGARNLIFFMGAALLAAALLGLIVSRGTLLTVGLKARMSADAVHSRLAKEARGLGLTYESALAAPASAVGKPALWCLRKRSAGPAAYLGDDSRPVYITNALEMPDCPGSMHQTCADTLVVIETFTAAQFGEARGIRLEARFIAYP